MDFDPTPIGGPYTPRGVSDPRPALAGGHRVGEPSSSYKRNEYNFMDKTLYPLRRNGYSAAGH